MNHDDNRLEDMAYEISQRIRAESKVIKASFMKDGSGYIKRKLATLALMKEIEEAVK